MKTARIARLFPCYEGVYGLSVKCRDQHGVFGCSRRLRTLAQLVDNIPGHPGRAHKVGYRGVLAIHVPNQRVSKVTAHEDA